jgi:hypothetical protein
MSKVSLAPRHIVAPAAMDDECVRASALGCSQTQQHSIPQIRDGRLLVRVGVMKATLNTKIKIAQLSWAKIKCMKERGA